MTTTPDASSRSTEEAPLAAASERPELAVGAAFAGGFALALILKRLVR